MNVAVKIFKIFAAMSDHGPGKRRHGFGGNLDRAGGEKLVVGLHQENVERSTRLRKATARQAPNVQCRIRHSAAGDGGHYSSVALDETDVTAAFETGGLDFRYVISLGIETQILL